MSPTPIWSSPTPPSTGSPTPPPSSARFYYENAHEEKATEPSTFPIGLASFAYDFRPLRRFAERDHHNIASWSEFDRGGHWAAHDAPDLLIADIRQFFRKLR